MTTEIFTTIQFVSMHSVSRQSKTIFPMHITKKEKFQQLHLYLHVHFKRLVYNGIDIVFNFEEIYIRIKQRSVKIDMKNCYQNNFN